MNIFKGDISCPGGRVSEKCRIKRSKESFGYSIERKRSRSIMNLSGLLKLITIKNQNLWKKGSRRLYLTINRFTFSQVSTSINLTTYVIGKNNVYEMDNKYD